MVKLDYDNFVSKVDELFTNAKEKGSIYFTFKRLFTENYKFKRNKKVRKLRREDHFNQEAEKDKQYSVLVRAKLNNKRIQTVIKPNEINSFHNILMKIFSLHFITTDDNNNNNRKKLKVSNLNNLKSKTQRRKEKKLKKLGKRKEEQKVNNNNNNDK